MWYVSHTIALLKLVQKDKFSAWDFLAYPCPPLVKKLLIQGVASFTGFKTLTCNILSFFSSLKTSFKWMGICWQGLLRCNTRIHLNMVWGTRKASNTSKNISISDKNLFLACNELGNHTYMVRHFRLFLWHMNINLGLGILWVVSTTSNQTGSRWKIVQSTSRLNQAKSKSCCTW